MNRKIVAGLALALIVSISAFAVVTTVHTDEFFESDAATTITYSYDTGAKTATVTGISGVDANTEIYIPAEVSSGGNSYHVTKILGNALNWPRANAGASLKIGQPDSPVKSIEIESGAFSQVNTLTTVEIYGNVSTIGGNAFYSTSGLKTFIVYGSVDTINNNAFQFSTVESVAIHGDVKDINSNAFASTLNLKTFIVYGSVDIIGTQAFRSSAVESVAIHGDVKDINSNAFASTPKFKTLTVYGNVRDIGKHVSQGSSLESVEIHGNVRTIGEDAFSGTSLEAISVYGSIDKIEFHAFHSTNKLKSANLGGAKYIEGANAFYGSTVKDITLSNDVIMEESAFSQVQLDTVYVTDATSVEGRLLSKFGDTWSLGDLSTVKTLIIDCDPDTLVNSEGHSLIGSGGSQKNLIYHNTLDGDDLYILYRYSPTDHKWVVVDTTAEEANQIIVVFDHQSNSGSKTTYILDKNSNLPVVVPEVYRHGLELLGWYNAPDAGTKILTAEAKNYTPSGSITLYARWTLSEDVWHEIIYNIDGGSEPAPPPITKRGEFETVLPDYNGFKGDLIFGGWSDGMSTHTPGSIYVVDRMLVILTAVWVPEFSDVDVEVIGIGVDPVDSADLYLNDNETPVVILGGTFSMNTEDVLTIVTEGGYTYFTAGFIEVDGGFKLDPSASVFRVYILEELVFIDPNLLFAVIHTSSDTASLDLSDYEAYDEIEHWFVAGTGVIVHVDNDELVLTVPPGLIGTVPVVVTLSDGNGSLLYCHILLVILSGPGFIIPSA